MSDELFLFGDEPSPDKPAERQDPIVDWQLDQIRRGFDARGTTDMAARQALVVGWVRRSVSNLRELSFREGQAVLNALGPLPAPKESTGSAWDDREEDTWIDRL